jgi:hypothetical protein
VCVRATLGTERRTTAEHEIWLDKKLVAGEALKDFEPFHGEFYLPRKAYLVMIFFFLFNATVTVPTVTVPTTSECPLTATRHSYTVHPFSSIIPLVHLPFFIISGRLSSTSGARRLQENRGPFCPHSHIQRSSSLPRIPFSTLGQRQYTQTFLFSSLVSSCSY